MKKYLVSAIIDNGEILCMFEYEAECRAIAHTQGAKIIENRFPYLESYILRVGEVQ